MTERVAGLSRVETPCPISDSLIVIIQKEDKLDVKFSGKTGDVEPFSVALDLKFDNLKVTYGEEEVYLRVIKMVGPVLKDNTLGWWCTLYKTEPKPTI